MFMVGDILWVAMDEAIPPKYTGQVITYDSWNPEFHSYTVFLEEGLWHREDGPAFVCRDTNDYHWYYHDKWCGLGLQKPGNFPYPNF